MLAREEWMSELTTHPDFIDFLNTYGNPLCETTIIDPFDETLYVVVKTGLKDLIKHNEENNPFYKYKILHDLEVVLNDIQHGLRMNGDPSSYFIDTVIEDPGNDELVIAIGYN